MNYLKGKVAYLCGALKAHPNSGIQWRNHITPHLEKLDIDILNPCSKTDSQAHEIGKQKAAFRKIIKQENWGKIKEVFWPVVRYDLRCIDKCDFVVFNYQPNIPTIGSIHELVVANFEKKPILLKYEKKDLDTFNPWITTLVKTEHFFSEWNDMIQYLQKVNDGTLDSSYWVL